MREKKYYVHARIENPEHYIREIARMQEALQVLKSSAHFLGLNLPEMELCEVKESGEENPPTDCNQ